jgi:CRISPR/Cas system-associated exonuclease Cas4 (RecB family)
MSYPRVTAILADIFDPFSTIRPEIMEEAQDRGTYVHKITELYDRDNLLDYDKKYEKHFSGWEKFINEVNPKMIEIEKSIVSEKYKYRGTLDRVAELKEILVYDIRAKKPVKISGMSILDIKTGCEMPYVDLQTAAYKIAYEEQEKQKIKNRLTVYLKKDGTCKLILLSNSYDERVFLNTLNIYNFKRNHNLIKEFEK